MIDIYNIKVDSFIEGIKYYKNNTAKNSVYSIIKNMNKYVHWYML